MPSADSIFNPPTYYGGAVRNPNYKAPSSDNEQGFSSADPNKNTNPNFPSNVGTSNPKNVTPIISRRSSPVISRRSRGGSRSSSGGSSVPFAPQVQQVQEQEKVVFTPEQVAAQRLADERAANEKQIQDYYARQGPGTYQYATDSHGRGYSIAPDLLNRPNAIDSQGRGYSIAPSILEEERKKQAVKDFFTPKFVSSGPEQSAFEKAVAAQQKRQADFENSEGFARVRNTANFLTFGRGVSYDERSFVGKVAENVVYGAMAGPIQVGGSLGLAAEKEYLTLRYIYDPKFSNSQENVFQRVGNVAAESYRAGKETFVTVYNPTTPEGASTYAGATLFALVPAAEKTIANRNALFFKEFENVKQTGSDVLFTRNVERLSNQRYIESNVLPKSDFLVSEIVKSKQTEVSIVPKEVLLKFSLDEPGRTGTRLVVQDLNTGRVSVVDRIQAENVLFRDGKGDFIRTIDSTQKPGVYDVKVYNTKDYLSNGKPFLEKVFVDNSASFSIGGSKVVDDFYLRQGVNLRSAEQSGRVVLTRDVVSGDFLQSTKYSFDVTQKVKLDRPYIVYSEKELARIFNTKESYLGVKESYKSQRARVEFGEEQFYPNIVERRGYTVYETKNPQIISETFIMRDVDVSIRKLTAEESKAFIQKGGFSEKSYLGGRIKYYKGLDVSFSERFGGPMVEAYKVMLRSKKGSLGRSIELDRVSSITVKSASLDVYDNVKAFDVNIPKLNFRTGNVLQLVPTSQRRAAPFDVYKRNVPAFKNLSSQFNYNEFKIRQNNSLDISSDVVSVQSNLLRQSSVNSRDVFQVQKLSQSQSQVVARASFKPVRMDFKIPRADFIFLPLPFKFKPKKSSKFGKKKVSKDNFGFKFKEKSYQRYILPSLRAVNITEFHGVEAKVPRATKRIVNQAYAQLRGFDLISIIPTEQLRTRRVKL